MLEPMCVDVGKMASNLRLGIGTEPIAWHIAVDPYDLPSRVDEVRTSRVFRATVPSSIMR
jgi:hypothetical protein